MEPPRPQPGRRRRSSSRWAEVRWSACVERADLDPNVHVILVSGRGEGFCAGFDLGAYADGSGSAGGDDRAGTVLDAGTVAVGFDVPTSCPEPG